MYFLFVFFTQKTAYEGRIMDWSSNVCSSDLRSAPHRRAPAHRAAPRPTAFSGGRTERGETSYAMFMPQSGPIENDQRRHIGPSRSEKGRFVPLARDRRAQPWTRKMTCLLPRTPLPGTLRSEEHTSELQS